MKIFLDDFRIPRNCLNYMHTRIGDGLVKLYADEDWNIVTNYEEFKTEVMKHFQKITHISFDHDLAEEHYNPSMMVSDDDYDALYETFREPTGKECAEWLKNYYKKHNRQLPMILVHSMNPVGRQNILNVFLNFKSN